MIEDVEEVSEHFVVMRRALENQFGAGNIEGAETACETKEIDSHLGWRLRLFAFGNVLLACNLCDVAGWKIEFDDGSEVDDLLCRIRALSGWNQKFTIQGLNDLEQANGLKKI